jgi:hypothetical protein
MRAQHIKIHYRLHSILKYIIDYRFNTLIFEFTECVAQHIIDYRFNTGIFEFTNKSGWKTIWDLWDLYGIYH